MIAWTKAGRFPGVRCCTSKTIAVLPLYFIACPLRRSFAAAMGRKVKVRIMKENWGARTLHEHRHLATTRRHPERKRRTAPAKLDHASQKCNHRSLCEVPTVFAVRDD